MGFSEFTVAVLVCSKLGKVPGIFLFAIHLSLLKQHEGEVAAHVLVLPCQPYISTPSPQLQIGDLLLAPEYIIIQRSCVQNEQREL
jgi:hypothetical protein